jgi:N,N-dimethylformamidase beta subunit-like protein
MRRRVFLLRALTSVAALGAAGVGAAGIAQDALKKPSEQKPRNPIVDENQLSGTATWRITKLAQRREIEGYASAASVSQGGTIDLSVSTSVPKSFQIEFFRMGWYGGLGGRQVVPEGEASAIGPLSGEPQPTPVAGSGPDYLIEARWPVAYTLKVPTTWTSGYYVAKLTREDGFERYVIFVVRDPRSTAPILMQASITTWQAYNSWGGKSLYRSVDFDAASPKFGTQTGGDPTRAGVVSFDRPYETSHEMDGAGEFFVWEANMVRWLEREGYHVTYATDLELHADPNLLRGRTAFLSVGHDEYWSNEMRLNVTRARDDGVHLGFFGSNAMYWRIAFAPNAAGVANRRVVCYKNADRDKTTTRWRDQARPENSILGVMHSGVLTTDFVVLDPGHWIFAGTGFAAGDRVKNLVGYEYDRTFANGFTPPGLTVLARSVVADDIAETATYEAPSKAIVFTAGTNFWSWGIDGYRHDSMPPFPKIAAHPGIERATRNIVDQMLMQPVQARR